MSTVVKISEVKGTEKSDVDIKPGNFSRSGKPIILSSQRFNKIINNSTSTERAKVEAEQEQKYKEQLKAGSDELVAHFEGNMQRTPEQKLQQIIEQKDKKTKQGIANYEQAKENEVKKRQEKIAKAEQIIERLKPGPRDLHSAVLQSEVLRARNVQRAINTEFEKATKQQEYETTKLCNEHALNWIGEEQKRLNERQKNTNAYKKDLLQTINENRNQRFELKKQILKEQQAARQVTDIEENAQIEKERALMEKKKESLRKSALEAMKMVEQRRLRDRMVEGLENRLCCVYNAGKSKLDALRDEQNRKLTDEQQRRVEAEVKNLTELEDNSKALESARIRRDITTMQLKFTAEEQEKVRKDKAAKQARIEDHLKEMQRKKEMQLAMEEEKRFEVAQRFKNYEVNCLFAEQQKEQKWRQFQNVRSQLDKQIDENKRYQLLQKQVAQSCVDTTLEKEHKYFFEHARNLIEDAQQKGRPLYPFARVVNQYKRENQIDCDRKIPKHLQSNIPIGESFVKVEKNENGKQNSTRDSILQNCLKINEIIGAASSTQVENTNLEKPALENCETSEQADIRAGCTSPQLRYSMDELKKINQFAAPTCH